MDSTLTRSGCTEVQASRARTRLTVTKCSIATSAKTCTTHYTLSALPCIISTVTLSDPSSGEERGK